MASLNYYFIMWNFVKIIVCYGPGFDYPSLILLGYLFFILGLDLWGFCNRPCVIDVLYLMDMILVCI